jgi:hypothetical protein
MAPTAALTKLHSTDKTLQNEAFQELMALTAAPVPWAYEIWDDIVKTCADKDNRRRAIAAQVLANLAQSDPEGRMARAFPFLLNVTRDERFVTARHALESLWKVAIVGVANQKLVLTGLRNRFVECAAEKNCTLIRYDITVVLQTIHAHTNDDGVRALSQELIATETDEKYKKKYLTVWRTKR